MIKFFKTNKFDIKTDRTKWMHGIGLKFQNIPARTDLIPIHFPLRCDDTFRNGGHTSGSGLVDAVFHLPRHGRVYLIWPLLVPGEGLGLTRRPQLSWRLPFSKNVMKDMAVASCELFCSVLGGLRMECNNVVMYAKYLTFGNSLWSGVKGKWLLKLLLPLWVKWKVEWVNGIEGCF